MKTFLKRYYPVFITIFILPLIIGCGSSSSNPTYPQTELSAEDFGTIGDGNFHDYGTGGDNSIIAGNPDSVISGYDWKYDDDEADPETQSDEKDEFSDEEEVVSD